MGFGFWDLDFEEISVYPRSIQHQKNEKGKRKKKRSSASSIEYLVSSIQQRASS
jgi:hypothetical protein